MLCELRYEITKLGKARQNASDGFTFASDWLRTWCECFGPITERSKVKAISDFFRYSVETCSAASMDFLCGEKCDVIHRRKIPQHLNLVMA